MRHADPPPLWPFQSAVPGVVWPAIPPPGAATALAVLHQYEQSQWLAPEAILDLQLRQLEGLLRHAFATVPWYRERWRERYESTGALTYEAFARLPLLSRRELQGNFTTLCSARSPKEHGPAREKRTSGSTGAPVRLLATNLTQLYWNAFSLREHAWYRNDFSQKLAVVRRESEHSRAANWGPSTAGLVKTGLCVAHSVRSDAATLLDWLQAENPGYLLTYPSLVVELARLSIARNVRLPGLLQVRTFAESLGADVRALCREAWDVPVVDVYSATEVGYIALQCPEHEHYHVQSEGVLLEVLDDAGMQCQPGQVGRVVVTDLHNFAMPIVRYDIGDYAEAGAPCPCGRGLPVLSRILGRVRNTLVTADGKRYWPAFGMRALMDSAPLQQYQFVQKTPLLVEARLVVAAPLTTRQEAAFRERVQSFLPSGIDVQIVYCERIERSAGGKYEEFVSEVSAAG